MAKKNKLTEAAGGLKDASTGFFKDFKAFISRGNVVDMAVGVIIGGAFGKIVTSLVNDVLMPVIGLLFGKVNFTELKAVLHPAVVNEVTGEIITPESALLYGNFIQQIVDFLIIAFCIFLMVRLIGKFRARSDAAKAAAEAAAAEEAKQAEEDAAAKAKRRDEVQEEILAALKDIQANTKK